MKLSIVPTKFGAAKRSLRSAHRTRASLMAAFVKESRATPRRASAPGRCTKRSTIHCVLPAPGHASTKTLPGFSMSSRCGSVNTSSDIFPLLQCCLDSLFQVLGALEVAAGTDQGGDVVSELAFADVPPFGFAELAIKGLCWARARLDGQP